jgi:hypothetical protein
MVVAVAVAASRSRSRSMAGEANPLTEDMWDMFGERDGGRRPEPGAGS